MYTSDLLGTAKQSLSLTEIFGSQLPPLVLTSVVAHAGVMNNMASEYRVFN